jgi:hypothetical protein
MHDVRRFEVERILHEITREAVSGRFMLQAQSAVLAMRLPILLNAEGYAALQEVGLSHDDVHKAVDVLVGAGQARLVPGADGVWIGKRDGQEGRVLKVEMRA